MQLPNKISQMLGEDDVRRKRLVIIGIGAIIILIVVFVFLVVKTEQNKSKQLGEYKDPGSGETVSDPVDKSPETGGITDAQAPIFLGFSKLLDEGMSLDQLNGVKEAFYRYSKTTEPRIKEISADVKSIDSTYPKADSPDQRVVIKFDVTFDRKTVFHARAEYSNLTTVQLYLSDSQNKQVYQSGDIDMTNPDIYD